MQEYEKREELMLTGQEIFEMAKAARLLGYLQSKFKIDLEIFANVLKDCERAGKISWTDEEILNIAFKLRDAQDKIDYRALVKSVVGGTA